MLIKVIGSSPAWRVTGLLTSGIAFVSTCCMYTRNTVPTSARCAVNASLSHPASTSTCEYTAVRGRTSVLTASRLSQLLLFYAHTSGNIAARSHSSAGIVGARSPRTPRMIVTYVALTPKRSRAFVNTAERLLHSRTN